MLVTLVQHGDGTLACIIRQEKKIKVIEIVKEKTLFVDSLIMKILRSWRESAVDRVFALYASNLILIPGTFYGLLSPSRNDT